MTEYILITYTTRYRKGGDQFKRVAKTLANEKINNLNEVKCEAVESKNELKKIFHEIQKEGNLIKEYHFIGHSGMYGPMYGSIDYPEQFSPFELRHLRIPFAEEASAYFHCCRSARWFAPFFAQIHAVKTYGYHWYTTFSKNKEYFQIDINSANTDALYCFGCPGRKSHGYLTSARKYLGRVKAEQFKEFLPSSAKVDKSYEHVASLYHNTFKDIKVRKDEFGWLLKHLPKNDNIRLLDIGCGNGALLKALSDKIVNGTGVDVSDNLLTLAQKHNTENNHIQFQKLEGPELPFEDNSFNLVISMLSFRYLDWDPILEEIIRVLDSEGKLLIIDMVTAPVSWREYPQLITSKVSQLLAKYRNPEFYKNLNKLVTDGNWKRMLRYNPIRSQHEMKWYLESRFPNRRVEVINVGYHSRIIAFDSINMKNVNNIRLSYP